MAIAKMRKLQLVAMSYDKEKLLDIMQQTGAVEIVFDEENEPSAPVQPNEELIAELASVETALDALCLAVQKAGNKEDEPYLQDGFDVTYSEFFDCANKVEEVTAIVANVNGLVDTKNALLTKRTSLAREKEQAKPYAKLQMPFVKYASTAHVQSCLGTVGLQAKEELRALEEEQLCSYTLLSETEQSVLLHVVYHNSVCEKINELLTSIGFVGYTYPQEKTGKEIYENILKEETLAEEQIAQNGTTMYALKGHIRLLKVYCDYLKFCLEKAEITQKMQGTERTFFLHAYVLEEAENGVREAILSVSQAAYMEFSEPTKEDTPPTLLKNNAIVSNFESITNTFSVPNYREFDPNAVMSFFYSLFMGFIIGDAGYGLCMAIIGGLLWWKNREKPSSLSKLAGAFAVGGVFAIFWGVLFNSFFGFMLPMKTVMPNPQTDMWYLAGIAVPSVLIISMEIGIFQLCVGYICKAVQQWRRGNTLDGICDGIVWAIFSIGVALAIVGFVYEANMPILATVGGITAILSLLTAMLTAGRKEKFFGKLTKGFGALYGIINYASDVLSYARLYGLMLSGAVIASIVATYSTQFIGSGNVVIALLGIVLLVVGHGFNLVMNLLGAYIHDARLQYVEFYGRFFEGEGTEFSPLGAKHKYIALTKKSI